MLLLLKLLGYRRAQQHFTIFQLKTMLGIVVNSEENNNRLQKNSLIQWEDKWQLKFNTEVRIICFGSEIRRGNANKMALC